MSVQASCPECKKRFRVPHADKRWRCKDCKGVLVLDAAPETSHAPLERCPNCDFENGPGAQFCEECGAAQPASDAALRGDRDKKRRQEAAQEMRDARRAILRLSNFLKVVLVFSGLSLAVAIVSVWKARSAGFSSGASYLGIGIRGIEFGLLIAVVHGLRQRPFPAALTLAVIASVNLVLTVLLKDPSANLYWVTIGSRGLLLLSYWYVTARAATLTKLADEHPELHAGPGLGRGTRGRARYRPPYLALGLVAAVTLGAIGFDLSQRPSDPDETLAGLSAAWTARDYEALASYGAEGEHEKWQRNFERLAKIYHWGDEWPEAEGCEYEQENVLLSAVLNTEAGAIPIDMRWSGSAGWVLHRISFEEVRHWKKP